MRKLATFCAAFAFGTFLVQYALSQENLLLAALTALVLGGVGLILLRRYRLRVALLTVGFAIALVYNFGYSALVLAPNEALNGAVETLTLELVDHPRATPYGAKVEVKILDRDLRGHAMYYGDETLLAHAVGERFTEEVELESAAHLIDDEDILLTFPARGVYLLAYSRGEPAFLAADDAALRYAPQRAAHRVAAAIDELFPAREAGFFRAILLGDKSGLDAEDASNLSEAGLYHITAVSGLHCAFLLTMLLHLVGRGRQKLLAAIAIPLLAAYALMVGASPSVVRACIMLTMVLLAPLFDRESDPPTALAFALLLILLGNPFAIGSISLQLSFSAMAGLLWLTPKLTAHIGACGKVRRVVLTSLAATAGALVFSTPVSVYYFGTLALVAPLSNLLCLWAASVTFAAGMIAMILSIAMPFAAPILSAVPLLGANYILAISDVLANLPLHAVYFNNPLTILWLVYVYALLMVCVISRRGKKRWWVALVLALAMLSVTAKLNTVPTERGALSVTALDVGQGESVVLLSGDSAALVDCGSSNSIVDAGDVAADYLITAGCRSLDTLVLTHYHADHANGMATLLARIDVDTLLVPELDDDDSLRDEILALAERYDVEVVYVTDVTEVENGDATLTIYPPLGEGSVNERGLTILCTTGDFDVLITGDMEGKTERALVSTYALPDIEVLLVGHHGSKYSTSTDLLNATTPEVGIISVGRNSYGHPTTEALYRLTDADIAVYRTDLQGNIQITVN